MPREASALTPDLLARVRPGAAVAVAVNAATGIQRKRPSGYRYASARSAVVEASSKGRPSAAPQGTVAVVEVRGVIEQRESAWNCGETCGYDGIERDVCGALVDPGVAALVVDIDSPGGDEPGLVETTDRIRAVVDALGKPVLIYSPALLASAAVYLALGIGDATYIHASARAGSVSSVVLFATEARKLATDGVDVYVARGVPGKMNPNPLEALDDLGKARLDRHALACSEDFVAFVAAARGLDPTVVRAWNADLFRGQFAVAAGLIDGLGTLDSVIALAGSLAGLQEAA